MDEKTSRWVKDRQAQLNELRARPGNGATVHGLGNHIATVTATLQLIESTGLRDELAQRVDDALTKIRKLVK